MDYQWKIFKNLSRAGIGSTASDVYYRSVGRDHLPEVTEEIRDIEYEYDKGEVLLPIVQGEYGFNSYMYCLLAHAFRVRGYKPIMPICSRDLPICMRKENYDDPAICDRCTTYSDHLFKLFSLSPIQMNDLENSSGHEVNNNDGNIEYRDVNLTKFVEASTRRFIRKYHIDLDDDYERSIFQRFIYSSKILVDMTYSLMNKHNFDAVIAHDPAYVYGGIFLDIAAKNGIPAKSIDIGYYRDKSIIVGDATNESPLPQYTDRDFVNEYLNRELSDKQKTQVLDFINKRMSESFDGINYTRSAKKSTKIGEAPVYGLFTNLLWDGSLTTNNKRTFDNTFVWVKNSIEQATDSSYELIIKTHPAESHLETNESMVDFINSEFESLPENVSILSPDTEVDPYQLIRDIDLTIVWNSTLGLEAALCGEPVVVTGDTHYRGYGFTYEPASPDEYFDLLDQPPEMMSETMKKRANRYGHLLFEKKLIDFPYFKQDEESIELLPCTGKGLNPGNDNIDMLVEKIISDEPVIQ